VTKTVQENKSIIALAKVAGVRWEVWHWAPVQNEMFYWGIFSTVSAAILFFSRRYAIA